MGTKKLLLIVLGSLLGACVYQPKGDFVNPIAPPDGSDTKVVLTPETELIKLSIPTTFSFSVAPADKGIYDAIITYDNVVVKETRSETGTFTFALSPKGHPPEGTLTIKVVYPSRSPSLAGQLGVEAIFFQQTWKVITDLNPPPPIEAPMVAIENGRTMIRWVSPPKFNFMELIVLRTYANGRRDSLKVPNKNSTAYEDKTYAGGEVTYSVDMKGFFYQAGKQTSFTCTPITISRDVQTGEISWPTPLLYGNPNLFAYAGGSYFPINEAGSYNPYVMFGNYQLVLVNVGPYSTETGTPGHAYFVNQKTFRGHEISQFTHVQYHPGDNTYITKDASRLIKINGQTFAEVGSQTVASNLFFPLLISSNGQYAYVFDNQHIYRFDPATLNIIETFSLAPFFSSLIAITGSGTVTNDNLVAVNFYATGSYIFDMNTKTVAWHSNAYETAILSPDGNYLAYNNQVFARGSGNWDVLVGYLSGSANYVDLQFRTGTNLLYVREAFSKLVYVFDLASTPVNGDQLIPTLTSLPPSLRLSYDQTSGKLYLRTGNDYTAGYYGDLHLYNPDTFEELKVITSISWNSYDIFYVKNALFHQLGYVLP